MIYVQDCDGETVAAFTLDELAGTTTIDPANEAPRLFASLVMLARSAFEHQVVIEEQRAVIATWTGA